MDGDGFAARREPSGRERHAWPAQPQYLRPMRAVVRRWLARLGVSEDTQQDLVLAVSEAAANAVEHAYPSEPRARAMVELSLWAERHVLCLEIVDHGTWRPPVANPPAERGRGIELMRKLADTVAIRQSTTGTTVLLQHLLPNIGDGSVSSRW